MPEGLQVVPALSPGSNAPASDRNRCWRALQADRAPTNLLARIAGEISDLEREIAFLDALRRIHEQCSLAD